ncbi:MAG TPA: hypothetical protein ENJ95_04040 [Bacteroidetes bacterium]|nr:hypothetical protein [Bacteroidota bacterium]
MMKETIYEIENEAANEGCFVSIIKYTVFSIVGFIFVWYYAINLLNKYIFGHGAFFSFFIAATVISYLLYKIINKSDKVYKLVFNDKERKLLLVSGNTFDGMDAKREINYENVRIETTIRPILKSKITIHKNTPLHSDKLNQNRKLDIYENKKLVNSIDIDLTSWCRHEKIEELIEKLKTISKH